MKKIVCFLMAVMMMAGVVQISSFVSEGAFAGLKVEPGQAGEACYNSILGLRPWYAGLEVNDTTSCDVQMQDNCDEGCVAGFVWTIVGNVVYDLMLIVGTVAVGFIIYGGYLFITSEGDPSKASKAKKTLTGAIIGLVIAILATVIINTIIGILEG